MYGASTYGATGYGAASNASLPPIFIPDPDPDPDPDPGPGTGPTPVPIPVNAPNIYAATIMRRSVINTTVVLGPASLNLTVRIP